MTFTPTSPAHADDRADSDEADSGSIRPIPRVGEVPASVRVHDDTLESRREAGSGEPAGLLMGRLTDALFSASALIVLFPVFGLICLAIWLHDRGPPIFAHRRIGQAGKSFPCLKFRTMVEDAEERLAHVLQSDPRAAEEWKCSHKLRADPRITPIGAVLRKTSLDEMPQLINVLIGHMSLVGPRPIVEKEIPHYGRYFAHYCSVRPGITGLWQVSGRNNLSYRRRVVIDTVYCRSKSLALDFFILTRTVPAVLMQKGAS